MIKNPLNGEWTKKDLGLIKKLRAPVVNPDKKLARKIWDDGVAKAMFSSFEEYWKGIINQKVLETRCERCECYPCSAIADLFKGSREIVICWIFHGSSCHKFTAKEKT